MKCLNFHSAGAAQDHRSQMTLDIFCGKQIPSKKSLSILGRKVWSKITLNMKNIKTTPFTAPKINFSIKDFFSKCDQIRCFLWIWSHLLKKSLMEKFIFCAVLFYASSKERLFTSFTHIS